MAAALPTGGGLRQEGARRAFEGWGLREADPETETVWKCVKAFSWDRLFERRATVEDWAGEETYLPCTLNGPRPTHWDLWSLDSPLKLCPATGRGPAHPNQ